MSDEKERRSRQRFDKEFKREAVDRLHSSGKGLAQVARELGVNENNLRNWSEKFKAKEVTETGMTLQELQAENRRLRKEVLERTEEVTILKKAATFFATHGKG